MTKIKKFLLYFLLPLLAVMLMPPEVLISGYIAIILLVIVFAAVALLIYRGKARALTFAIFLQGLNGIIRILMFFPNSKGETGPIDYAFMITSILSIGLSIYLLIRLDQNDVRAQMA
jgi:hypothetical protein